MADTGPGFREFFTEAAPVAQAFMTAVEAGAEASALDMKTAELGYLAVLAATRMTGGIAFHTDLAKRNGATRDEVISAILLGLPAVGLQILDALPIAVQAYDEAD